MSLYCKNHYIIDAYFMDKITNIIWIIRFVMLHLIPPLVVTICMTACVVTVNKRRVVSRRSPDQRSKTQTMIMMVLVMLIFVFGEFPTTLGMFLYVFLPTIPNWLSTNDGVQFANFTLVFSFLMNILVYVGMSKKFRKSVKEFICRLSPEQ